MSTLQSGSASPVWFRRMALLSALLVLLPAIVLAVAPPRLTSAADSTRVAELSEKILNLHFEARFAEAIPFAEENLRIRRSAIGEGVESWWETLDAKLQLERTRAAAALPEAARKEVALAEHGAAVTMMDCFQAGDWTGAKEVLENSLQVFRKYLGGDHPAVGEGLANLGAFAFVLQQTDEAELHIRRALEILRAVPLGDHPTVASALDVQGMILLRRGEFSEAERIHWESLRIREAILPVEHPHLITGMINLLPLLEDLGAYTEAEELGQRALALALETLGEEHALTAGARNNLATILEERGEYAEAEAHYRHALQVFKRTRGPLHRDVAICSANLGVVLQLQGRAEEAREFLQQALDIHGHSTGVRNVNVAVALDNLASIEIDFGDFEAAERASREGLDIYRSEFGEDHPDVAYSLNTLARVLRAKGDLAAAEDYSRKALAVLEHCFESSNPALGLAQHRLGAILEAGGNYEEALDRHRAAHTIRMRAYGADHPDVAASLTHIAGCERALGRYDSALSHALEAEHISSEHLRLLTQSSTENASLSYAAYRLAARNQLLSIAMDEEQKDVDVGPVWDAVVRSRALVLDEMAQRQRSVADADMTVRALRDELADCRERLANLMYRGPDEGKADIYVKQLQEAHENRDRAERTLAEAWPGLGGSRGGDTFGLEEIESVLGSNDALVSFVLFEESPGNKNVDGGDGRAIYAAFVRGPVGQRQLISLGSAAKIDSAVVRWQHAMAKPAPVVNLAVWEENYRVTAMRLSEMIWQPIMSTIKEPSTLFIVPDGALHLVNLAALPMDDNRYVIDSPMEIHRLSAERDLLEFQQTPPIRTNETQGLLAIGGVDYDGKNYFGADSRALSVAGDQYRGSRSTCGEFDDLRFDFLPASEREVHDIKAKWTEAGQAISESILVLTGVDASEQAFKELAPLHRALHIATHGFFVGGECTSALMPAGDEEMVPMWKELRGRVAGENPLLLSGLAFAGANHRAASREGQEDGILTAEEIGALDLSGVEWAVLSACNTGLGRIEAGEGVLGLQRAFRVAGVASLVMSLWAVGDEPTRAWMTVFYDERLQRGRPVTAAARAASRVVLARRREQGVSTHPYYWAGFVGVGGER